MQTTVRPRGRADLRSIAADLTKSLGGYTTRSGAMCRCPAHEDRQPSLSVRIGTKALLFKCFAGCDTQDVLRALGRVDRRALARGEGGADVGLAAREAYLRERARDIWDSSVPILGSVAQDYLAARGINAPSPALRFHRRTPLGRQRNLTFRPALIAALHQGEDLVAVQRLFLDPETATKARDLRDPSRLLGRPLGGAVMLSPAGDVLGLAEGVETALSAKELLGIPVWATLGSERLPHIMVPDRVRHLVLLPDNDRSGRIGARKGMDAYAREDRVVETIWPWAGFNDWNDVLRARLSLERA